MPDLGDYEGYGRFEEACSVEQSYFAAAAETIGTELVIKQYVPPSHPRTIFPYALLATDLTFPTHTGNSVWVPQTWQESLKLKQTLITS